jgi:anti-anti-sigma regulatory factor
MAGRKKTARPVPPPAAPAAAEPVRAAAENAVPRGRRLVLGPALNIGAAKLLRAELLALVEGEGDVHLDGSAIESADPAGVQVLLAFQRALQDRGCRIRWTGCSAVLVDVCTLLGLAAQLGVAERA